MSEEAPKKKIPAPPLTAIAGGCACNCNQQPVKKDDKKEVKE